MQELKGKVALVTGGTGGIGSAICQKLADAGARIATTYRNEEKAKAWAADSAFDPIILACDVGDYGDCARMKEELESQLGQVDIVVNNAGITRDATFKKITPDHWQQVIKADLEMPGDEDVFRKVRGDFDAKGIDQSDHQLRRKMDELLATAAEQIQSEA